MFQAVLSLRPDLQQEQAQAQQEQAQAQQAQAQQEQAQAQQEQAQAQQEQAQAQQEQAQEQAISRPGVMFPAPTDMPTGRKRTRIQDGTAC